ncbi:hypothetical protein BX600DRAFT_493694 [Xylariales sp. PMI_506]|nr:hypothetical protein BX600DRAFT_493694 [Xylariales sp. PMI_506]
MQLGPFDQRKKRLRRSVRCTYAGTTVAYDKPTKTRAIISLDKGKQYTADHWKGERARDEGRQPNPTRSLVDAISTHWYWFDVFARRNNFLGQASATFAYEIRALGGLHDTTHLIDAMLSLGALQRCKTGSSDAGIIKASKNFALKSYVQSLSSLSKSLRVHVMHSHSRDVVLWTTLLLGLFELMSDATGYGWLRHMIHGTAKALEASKPLNCRTGTTRRFFIQAKVFEVSRTILFNESSFLTQPEWMDMSRSLFMDDDELVDQHPLNALLDIMAMCSQLRVRVVKHLQRHDNMLDSGLTDAQDICMEAFALREDLTSWHGSHTDVEWWSWYLGQAPQSCYQLLPKEGEILVQLFHAATSIYLSGIFDYEITYWKAQQLSPPTLEEEEVNRCVEVILQLARVVMHSTCLSPLLLLFPLRIAGARSWRHRQRDMIVELLAHIGRSFDAAFAIAADLKSVWELRHLNHPDRELVVHP